MPTFDDAPESAIEDQEFGEYLQDCYTETASGFGDDDDPEFSPQDLADLAALKAWMQGINYDYSF